MVVDALEIITSIIIIKMANCTSCGLKVSCGCQLVNGMCSACNYAAQKAKQKLKHVISKINQLY